VHAVLVRVTINDFDGAQQVLEEVVVPRASGAPGFVAGYWTRGADDNSGLSMIVFESEDAAKGAAQMIQSMGAPSDAVTVEGVEVRSVVAHA
jgi:hypothetical protein